MSIREDGVLGGGLLPEAIRFQGVKKLFYAFLPRQKKSMSERSEFGFF